jgi:hypothetical protein
MGYDRGRGRGFFLSPLCPDQLWDPPSVLSNGYRGSFLGGKVRPGRDADHSPNLVPRSRMSRSYISSPPWRLYGSNGTSLLFITTSVSIKVKHVTYKVCVSCLSTVFSKHSFAKKYLASYVRDASTNACRSSRNVSVIPNLECIDIF